jgi:hypothetical protein
MIILLSNPFCPLNFLQTILKYLFFSFSIPIFCKVSNALKNLNVYSFLTHQNYWKIVFTDSILSELSSGWIENKCNTVLFIMFRKLHCLRCRGFFIFTISPPTIFPQKFLDYQSNQIIVSLVAAPSSDSNHKIIN